MKGEFNPRTIPWYRVRIEKETMKELNKRSDWMGFLQTGGYLGLLALTATAAWLVRDRLYLLLPTLFLFGTFHAFLINGFHELVHNSVFKTRWLNTFFLWIFSFFGWYNHHMFWASHGQHHKFTLHPPDDLEVVLPVELTLKGFLKFAFVDPWRLYDAMKRTIRLSLGLLEGEWENHLFPPDEVEKRRRLFNWARILLVGHALIISFSIYFGLWLLPILTTFASFYGAWLFYLCNNTQHVGLKDNVPDFRLSCRTIILNPFVRFLYWHMNYHTEHHMYAVVPCYSLGKLHKLIKHELPQPTRGLVATWKEIIAILKKQKADPEYQHVPQLPTRAPI